MALRQSIARYAAGEFSRRDIEKVFASTLDHNPDAGEAIREYLDQQLHDRAISKSVYKDLLEQLGTHLPEDVPTESAEAPLEEAGVSPSQVASAIEAPLVTAPTEQKPAAIGSAAGSRQGKAVKSELPVAPAKASAQLGPGTILRERFRLDEAVASGSMGLVFRATDLLKLQAGAISPVIAIKVINPEFANNAAALRSFHNEVANTQHLSHPNIIRLFELDKDQGHYFITMEWLEGESLDALLDRSRGSALPPVQAYAIIEQLCDALDYAHSKQVIHADVKPGNVFLTKPGELKLIDFGIARILGPVDQSATQRERSVALTPAYASCECLERQTATAQDDLFSLACLIYRLLSGRRVFGARTALQAEAEGIQPIAIGGMSVRRWQALRKALAFRRADRQPDVQTFAAEFGQRNEARGKLAPEPDDVPYTDTTGIEFNIDDFQDELNDTGFLGDVQEPENPGQDIFDNIYLDNLIAPIKQPSGTPVDSARHTDRAAVRSDRERKVSKVSHSQPKSLLQTESLAAPETRLLTESTVPTERVGTGTIEIELLQEPALVRSDGSSSSAVLPVNKQPVSIAVPLPKTDGSAPSRKVESDAATAPVYSPAVKPAAPKATVKARSPVVQKLAAPAADLGARAKDTPAQQPTTHTRYLTVVVCVLVALGVALLSVLMGDPDADTGTAGALSADDIAVAVQPIDTLSETAGAVAPRLSLTPDSQGSVTLSASGKTQASLGATATGNAAAAVSESLQKAADSALQSRGRNSAASDASAAGSKSSTVADFNPNGPVAFSELQLERYVEPEFPAAFAGQGIEGWVDVKLAIAVDGSIRSVELIDTNLPPDFLPPSRAAALQWRFKPFVWNGIAMAPSTTVRLTYSN